MRSSAIGVPIGDPVIPEAAGDGQETPSDIPDTVSAKHGLLQDRPCAWKREPGGEVEDGRPCAWKTEPGVRWEMEGKSGDLCGWK